MQFRVPDLTPLLNPGAIAVVGASDRPDSPGRFALENLRFLKYPGAVYPVNPRHRELLGYRCYPSLDSLPGPVEAVALLLGAEKAVDLLPAASKSGAKAVWMLAVGFAESGPDGEARQTNLVELCEELGLLLCGPNCIGVANLVDGAAMYGVALSPSIRAGRVSIVSQSGAVCMGLANAAPFGFRYLISSGNEAVLDSADYISYLVADDQTDVIIAFIEGIRRPEKFITAARCAADCGKPILAVKVGRSDVARQAVSAHTGSLAGSDSVVDAVFRDLGITRLATLDELIQTAQLFLSGADPGTNGVGLMALSGGQVGLIADVSKSVGLQFPEFSDRTVTELSEMLPDTVIRNPLDVWGTSGREGIYPACVEIVSRDEGVGLLAVSRDTPSGVAESEVQQTLSVARAAARARLETGKPVVLFSNVSGGVDLQVEQALEADGIPYLQGTNYALQAIRHCLDYSDFRRRRNQYADARGGESPKELDCWRQRLMCADGALSELEGRQLLRAYGIPGPKERAASSRQEAIEAARDIGYPVVLKALSPGIQHKTEIDGVRLGLDSEASVARAFDEVLEAVRKARPQAQVAGALIQEMITYPAVEVILGVSVDRDFGPVVVFGSGGILVEVLEDVSIRVPPLSHREAQEMIAETRVSRLLKGFRGQPPADVEGATDALVRLSQLAVDLGDLITAVDVNPLLVLPGDRGVVAVDVVVETTLTVS